MKKLILITVFAFLLSVYSSGQDYDNGLGIRGGFGGGITFKHFVTDDVALEGILATQYGGFYVTGLYEIHKQAFNTYRLNWYYGFGAHVGFGEFNDSHPLIKKNGDYSLIGVDGIIGIEYNFSEIPINIGIDFKPMMEIIGKIGPVMGSGLSIRYLF